MNPSEPRLTSLSHGGGCGCKIAPGVLADILKQSPGFPVPPQLLVGIETADDAAVYLLNDEQALTAIEARVKAAQDRGISSTPSFFINGKKAKDGEMTLEELDAAVAAAMK